MLLGRFVFLLTAACILATALAPLALGQIEDNVPLHQNWTRKASVEVPRHFKLPPGITREELQGLTVYVWADLDTAGHVTNVSSKNHTWFRGRISTAKRDAIEAAMKQALLASSLNFARPRRPSTWGIAYCYMPSGHPIHRVGLCFRSKCDI